MSQAIKFKVGVVKLKFDRKGMTKATQEALQVIMRGGAREWLRATFIHVPVWTGMARGSLKFARGYGGVLSRVLNVAIPISPHPKARRSPKKTPERGGDLSEFTFIHTGRINRFRFRTDTFHYWHNEFFARTDGGAMGQQIIAPWHSFEYGKAAFRRYLQTEGLKKIPKLAKYLKTNAARHITSEVTGGD